MSKTVLMWDKHVETMPRGELEALQLSRLQKTAKRVYDNVPFYKKGFDERGVKPEDIRSLDDLSRLPFTIKNDLRDNYPFGLCTVPLRDVVRTHASSGTTGKPIVGPYTRADLDLFAECMSRVLISGGVTQDDVLFNAYGYGLFTGGLGFHYGSERIGATTVPVSAGLSKRQVTLWQDFGATILTCTPSYALVLAETAEEMGLTKDQLGFKAGFFGAEPWTEEMRKDIEDRLNLEAFDIFGLTELIGPGVAVECPYHDGLHIMEDHFLAEIIDPDTGEQKAPGEEGELVLTSLSKEAFPVIRYRTRDITTLNQERCRCGRTSVRMKKITGRTDDMLIVRGVNVFPSQIESVLLEHKELEPQYQIIVERVKNLDRMEVQVEASEDLYAQGEEVVRAMEEKVAKDLHQTLMLSAKVSVAAPKTIQRSEGKAKRVIDKRQLA